MRKTKEFNFHIHPPVQVQLDSDDILSWWSAAHCLPTLRRLARRVLAVPASCSSAHHLATRFSQARGVLPMATHRRIDDMMHVACNQV